jgi:hypothetical protein
MRRLASGWLPQFRSVAKGTSGELDQAVVLLWREHRAHVEHVLEYGLLQLALRMMDFLHGVPYACSSDN